MPYTAAVKGLSTAHGGGRTSEESCPGPIVTLEACSVLHQMPINGGVSKQKQRKGEKIERQTRRKGLS
jgi:hypothetical protein